MIEVAESDSWIFSSAIVRVTAKASDHVSALKDLTKILRDADIEFIDTVTCDSDPDAFDSDRQDEWCVVTVYLENTWDFELTELSKAVIKHVNKTGRSNVSVRL